MSALSEALRDLTSRATVIEEKPTTGSNQNRAMKGRGEGYAEAVRMIEAALAEDAAAEQKPEPPVTDNYSIDRHRNGTMTVRLTSFQSSEMLDVARLTLDPSQTLDFMTAVAREGSYALRDAVVSIGHGDCSTCKNIRMVNVPRNGREWQEHCPDCSPNGATFPPVPKIGGGFA